MSTVGTFLVQGRAQTAYSWEKVTDAYERLFYQLCGIPLPESLREAHFSEG